MFCCAACLHAKAPLNDGSQGYPPSLGGRGWAPFRWVILFFWHKVPPIPPRIDIMQTPPPKKSPPPPSAARATTGTGGSGGGLVRFAPNPKKRHAGTTHTCSSARRHLYSNRSTGGPVRYSKGSVGDHRSRESNHLLHGERWMRCHLSGCLLRGTGTWHREQPHRRTQPQHMQAPRHRPTSPPYVWLYVDLRKASTHWGF